MSDSTSDKLDAIFPISNYRPKHPSALVTIGSVLKALIENGILEYSEEDILRLTPFGIVLAEHHKGMNHTGPTQLKLEIEV